MATLNIEGRKVSIDDGFLKLSPDEQNATVEEIAKSLGAGQPKAPSVLSQAAAAAPVEVVTPAAAPDSGVTLRGIREAIHAPTRILENNLFLGLGDRMRAGIGSILGAGGYGDNLKQEQTETERYEHDHPVGAMASGLVGAAAAPVAAIGAAAKGANLITKSLLGATAGGTVGGLQGGFSSKDWTDLPQTLKDTAAGTLAGGFLGGMLPGAGQAIGAGVRAIADVVRGRANGMSRGATHHIVNAIEADGGMPVVRNEVSRLGDEAMLLDAGESLKGLAQGANLVAPEARSMTSTRLRSRDEATNDRIRGDVDRILGPAEDPVRATQNIVDYRTRVDNHNYPLVLRPAPPVEIAPIMRELDDAIASSVGNEQRALTNLRQMLTREQQQPRPDPFVPGRQATGRDGQPAFDTVQVSQDRAEVLHKVKQELDNVIEHELPGLGVQAGALRNQQFSLKRFRHDLNQALEDQVDGYARANRVSARLAHRAEEVKAGTGYLGEGKTTPSPERFLDEFEQKEVGQRIAFNKGSRGEIDRLIGTNSNNLTGLQKALRGEGSWNAEKLATVHGEQPTAQLLDSVDRNAHFRENFRDIVKNSQTAQRLTSKEALEPAVFKPNDIVAPGNSGAGMIASILKIGGSKLLNAVTGEHNLQTRTEIARILTERGPERERHILALADAMARRGQNANVSRGAVDTGLVGAASLANYLVDAQRRKRQ